MAKLSDLKLSDLASAYINLRDRRAKRKADYENADVDDKGKQEKIEIELLRRFNDQGIDSVKTAAGTPYKYVRTSVSVADREVFKDFVMSNDAWELLNLSANKTTVAAYKEEHNDIPPGLNLTESVEIGVRRA